MKCFIRLFMIWVGIAGVHAQDKKAEPNYEMKTYFLVLLKKGPMRNSHDSTTIQKIQAAHLANIDRLAQEGKIDLAGPCLHDGELRGIFVFNVASYEEAKALCDTDPAIKAGRLVAEIYPWMAAKGSSLK